jgi:hypothetical protein
MFQLRVPVVAAVVAAAVVAAVVAADTVPAEAMMAQKWIPSVNYYDPPK